MKYRYYITDTFDGEIKGTNETALVNQLRGCQEYFILDTEIDCWLQMDRNLPIKNYRDAHLHN
jgi:hypothetical protein